MIGVDVSSSSRPIVREFFQLFKTSWEFTVPGKRYEVQISTSRSPDVARADLTIVYHDQPGARPLAAAAPEEIRELAFSQNTLPIYRGVTSFPSVNPVLLRDRKTHAAALDAHRTGTATIINVGYALFSEVEFLLTIGQPVSYAGVPTLEHHIALLRELILRAGIAVVEIPPKPAGHPFIACLTHDIDHPLQRRHVFDTTMAGFLYRASIGSFFNVMRGRTTFRKAIQNFTAALQTPLLCTGLGRDRWSQFDKYLNIERGLGSTYFVIPRARYPGKKRTGSAPAKRRSGYGVEDIRTQLERIRAAGCEIGTHGLDAWVDADAGRREQDIVSTTIGTHASGVRMHWLYFDAQSPRTLESAGFSYDSTVGYNQTVGFRAGTVQAFMLPGTSLMELPLHVMDTALFYPSYLNLTEEAAFALVQDVIRFAAKNAGVLTFNWHDRSLFPERLWGDVYQEIIAELKHHGAWFPNARDAVQWFRLRRDANFAVKAIDGGAEISGSGSSSPNLPSLVVHVRTPPLRSASEPLATAGLHAPEEHPLSAQRHIRLK